MSKRILPALAFFLVAGVAAASEGTGTTAHLEANAELHGANFVTASSTLSERQGKDMPEMHASSTMQMRHGSSTPEMKDKAQKVIGVPGIVTSIGANSFTITAPAGKDHATTTLTVNLSSSTIFNKEEHTSTSTASTVVSSHNIIVGSHVLVLGKVSTSTNSVAATRVIVSGAPMKDEIKNSRGFMSHLKEFFGKHATSTMNVQASSTEAAAVQGGLIRSILHSLFGWM